MDELLRSSGLRMLIHFSNKCSALDTFIDSSWIIRKEITDTCPAVICYTSFTYVISVLSWNIWIFASLEHMMEQ